jgi:hypothetical protein
MIMSSHDDQTVSVSVNTDPLPLRRAAYIRHRKRSASSLESTPRPYKSYKRDPKGWYHLFSAFESRAARSESMLHWIQAHAAGINYHTFLRRHKQWITAGKPNSPDAVLPRDRSLSLPSCRISGLGDGRGGHNKKWTDQQEHDFSELFIKPLYIRNGDSLSNEDLRVLAKQFWRQVICHSVRTRRNGYHKFSASIEWTTRMKREHDLYSGCSKLQRQKHLTDKTTAIAVAFIEKVRAAYHRLGAGAVIAMDETFWQLHMKPLTTLKIKGEETTVTTAENPKAGITTILTVVADGSKLPIFFIAKGKTQRCCTKLAVSPPHLARPTESGWCRTEILFDYIKHVILPYTNNKPCLLILDCYKAHLSFAFRFRSLSPEAANIELAFVPGCMTAVLSPLDVVINPVIKSIGRSQFRKLALERRERGNPIKTGSESWATATACATKAFNSTSSSSVKTSFQQSIGFETLDCIAAHRKVQERQEQARCLAAGPTAQIEHIMQAFNSDIKPYNKNL